MGEFVDEGTYSECVVYVGHRTQPADANVADRLAIFHPKVREGIRSIGEAHAQFAGAAQPDVRSESGID